MFEASFVFQGRGPIILIPSRFDSGQLGRVGLHQAAQSSDVTRQRFKRLFGGRWRLFGKFGVKPLFQLSRLQIGEAVSLLTKFVVE